MYDWRKMTEADRAEVRIYRRLQDRPRHSPPHFVSGENLHYLVTAACYEHAMIIGKSRDRMSECETEVVRTSSEFGRVFGWSVLPNHYHLLPSTEKIVQLLGALGKFHGRSSFRWNREDNTRGRKVWFNSFERAMRSERHFWASLNYVHNNPVHHRYVSQWQEWPWSSAASFLEEVGRGRAIEIWNAYPLLDYGKKWDMF